MDLWAVRLLCLGGAAVLFARAFAYWLEWETWTVRIVGLVLLGLGIAGLAVAFGPGCALKALLGIGLCAGAYVWLDAKYEVQDLQRKDAEDERMREDAAQDDPREQEQRFRR